MNKMTIQIVINHSILTKDPSVSFYPLLWRSNDENLRELARRTSHIFAYLFLLRKKINRTNISWYMILYYISQPHTNSSVSKNDWVSFKCLLRGAICIYISGCADYNNKTYYILFYLFVCLRATMFVFR